VKSWTPKQIKRFRKELSLTQTKFGEMVGVAKITVFQWERGARTPSKTAKILLSRIEEEIKQ
jgi:DNA-binding transcriptional regulator YiaG